MDLYITGIKRTHVFKGSLPVNELYKGSVRVWRRENAPTITGFTAVPSSIDLDSSSPANITLSFQVAGTSGQVTNAHIVRVSDGVNIGQRYVSGPGVGISESFTVPRPTKNETYRLIASNDNGSAHSDQAVSVTQNAVISGFRRTGFQQVPGLQAGTFVFQATIRGYPQPALSYRFGNARQGAITARHLTATANSNEWTLNWSIYHTVLSDSLVLTATNSSNTTTSTINNISN